MPADLTAMYDHPAVLLETSHQGQSVSPDLQWAAARLRAYESTKGVTFAALSNDGLAAVREAYEIVCSDKGIGGMQADGVGDLMDAINGLLGLDD